MKIKDWAEDDRPREKMLQKGISSLSDAELIAILIGSGSRGKSAVELSQEILYDQNYDLNQLGRLNIQELTRKYKGIGTAKAITILTALEIGRRRNMHQSAKRFAITSSGDVYRHFQPLLSDLPHEEFWVAMLNQSNHIIHRQQISKGGIAETAVDVRIILKDALQRLATGLILVHNHPSGNNRPSAADDAFTRKMKEAAKLVDIRVLDHIIIGQDCYFSYADEGKI
jgi:DNA repair protein radc